MFIEKDLWAGYLISISLLKDIVHKTIVFSSGESTS